MSQDSSDEDSEEEEDFSRVQFGSRYTAAQCVCVFVCACSFMCPLHVAVGPGSLWLTVHTHQGRVVKNKLIKGDGG